MSTNAKIRSVGLEVEFLIGAGRNPMLNPMLAELCHFCVKPWFS